jgi:diaminopropionate ammonia-lyase
MAGLSAGEPSLLAWPVLGAGAHAFMTITDEAALEVMRRLASGRGDDPPVVGGESGVAGLAGLLALREHPGIAGAMGLDSHARVLCFGTEGDTDPDLYARIVGKPAAAVRGNG